MELLQKQVELAESVLRRRRTEKERHSPYPAFLRVSAKDGNGRNVVLWLVERGARGANWKTDKDGYPVGIIGDVEVSKNAQFGLLLDKNSERPGTVLELNSYQSRVWAGSLTILDTVHYVPAPADAKEGAMLLADVPPLYFQSLKRLLDELKAVESAPIREQPQAGDEDVERLLRDLLSQEAAAKQLLKDQQDRIRHIITGATLRVQPKLAEEQLEAKSSQILDGCLMIDGGPGTGKTTTLIDRISFLTADTIKEYVPNISPPELARLIEPNTGYLLCTPNELLLHYIKEAMNAKGLVADSRKVKTWSGYREELGGRFGFLKADSAASPFTRNKQAFRHGQRAFDFKTGETAQFLRRSWTELGSYIGSGFEAVLRVKPEDTSDPVAYAAVLSVLGQGPSRNVSDWIRVFESLHSRYAVKVADELEQSKEKLESLTARLVAGLFRDERAGEVMRLLDRDSPKVDDESRAAEEDDDNRTPEAQASSLDDGQRVFSAVRLFLRRQALTSPDSGTRLTRRDRELARLLAETDYESEVRILAPSLIFGTRLDQLVRSPERNVLQKIGAFYKRARVDPESSIHGAFSSFGVNRELDRNSKTLAPDELDTLLFLTLKCVLDFRRVAPALYKSSSHPFIRGHREEFREIVAVDEATDFSAIQLACMTMLSNPRHRCTSFSGDVMQRFTPDGLSSWEELEEVLPLVGVSSFSRHQLTMSFRQSNRLHAMTAGLWRGATGAEPPFESPYAPSAFDPPPLVLESNQTEEVGDWLASRIVEIRHAYDTEGLNPTIAVFVSDEDQISRVADAIEMSANLGDNIDVERCRDGKVLGSNSRVRVFDVQHIKGLEFEAALFVDLDRVAQRTPDLVDRILYVGLSRASLYLGVTVGSDLSAVLGDAAKNFETGDWKMS